MQVNIAVHPDFLNTARNKALTEITSEDYLQYIKALKTSIATWRLGLLAYHTKPGDKASTDTGPDFIELFSTEGRLLMPTKYGQGKPYDHEAEDTLAKFLVSSNASEVVLHGSYAQACVREMAEAVHQYFSGPVIFGTVLSRYFGNSSNVDHDRFRGMHPGLTDYLDQEQTQIFSVHRL